MSDGVGLWASFRAQVERQPDATALVWHQEEVSYGELAELATQAGARLEGLGLEEGEPVGILAKKSPAAIALVLASLRAGRRFLLPSPTLDEPTLQTLFAQAGCRHILGPADEPAPEARGGPRTSGAGSERQVGPDDIGFMLTTSGSTGLPKIVPLTVGAVDRFTDWAGEQFDIRPGKTVLNYAPLNFDLCLLDIWTTLARGGRVVLVDADHGGTNGAHLLDLIVRHEVNVIQAVPMFYRLLIDAADGDGGGLNGDLDGVEHVIFTGDAIPARSLAELPQLFRKARLYNLYGCTETNDSFVYEVDTTEPAPSPVPLGRPLPGVHALVVDGDGVVLNGPGAGELYVSTPFQTPGYLDQSRNADKFGPHPDGQDERRYFRTADLVRRDADGQVVLQGRSDFLVKVRGVGVNTAEVERVLLQHDQVTEAAVVAVPDPVAGRQLAGVVRRRPDGRLNSLVLRQHCAERLPQAAIPSMLKIADDPLPKTSTGKVDRKAVEQWFAVREEETKES